MNFIETLKSVGGVKPCKCWIGRGKSWPTCVDCYGTGQILDLAPLLAIPDILESAVAELLAIGYREPEEHVVNRFTHSKWLSFVVVGPQRASNLIYEVARQLGGTAVVAEPHRQIEDNVYGNPRIIQNGYRLSLPIPPDATVLFVTDRIERNHPDEEIIRTIRSKPFHDWIFAGKDSPVKILPYMLALVSGTDELDLHIDGKVMQVIALHEENRNGS